MKGASPESAARAGSTAKQPTTAHEHTENARACRRPGAAGYAAPLKCAECGAMAAFYTHTVRFDWKGGVGLDVCTCRECGEESTIGSHYL